MAYLYTVQTHDVVKFILFTPSSYNMLLFTCAPPFPQETTHSSILVRVHILMITFPFHEEQMHTVPYTSGSLGEQVSTASATVRKILSSPMRLAKPDACSLSITTLPGFARTSLTSLFCRLLRSSSKA